MGDEHNQRPNWTVERNEYPVYTEFSTVALASSTSPTFSASSTFAPPSLCPSPNNNTPSSGGVNAPKYGTLVPNRIFVGGLELSTTDDQLSTLFCSYGLIKSAKVIVDRAGVSKGYGFVTFVGEEDAKKLMMNSDHVQLNGRRLNIAPAIKKQGFVNGSRAYESLPNPQTLSYPHQSPVYFGATIPPFPYGNPYSYYVQHQPAQLHTTDTGSAAMFQAPYLNPGPGVGPNTQPPNNYQLMYQPQPPTGSQPIFMSQPQGQYSFQQQINVPSLPPSHQVHKRISVLHSSNFLPPDNINTPSSPNKTYLFTQRNAPSNNNDYHVDDGVWQKSSSEFDSSEQVLAYRRFTQSNGTWPQAHINCSPTFEWSEQVLAYNCFIQSGGTWPQGAVKLDDESRSNFKRSKKKMVCTYNMQNSGLWPERLVELSKESGFTINVGTHCMENIGTQSEKLSPPLGVSRSNGGGGFCLATEPTETASEALASTLPFSTLVEIHRDAGQRELNSHLRNFSRHSKRDKCVVHSDLLQSRPPAAKQEHCSPYVCVGPTDELHNPVDRHSISYDGLVKLPLQRTLASSRFETMLPLPGIPFLMEPTTRPFLESYVEPK